MSLPGRRLLATIVALWVVGVAAQATAAAAVPDSTWVATKPLPGQGRTAIFALAVDPSNKDVVLAANSQGSILRTGDGGASWTTVRTGKLAINTISFSPSTAGLVFAGTRGGGAYASRDGGVNWSAVAGLEGRSVRTFAYAVGLIAAGTDHGVYTSEDGSRWTQSGLTSPSISAIAVEAIHPPVRLLAGSDTVASGGTLSFFQSLDGGETWKRSSPAISGTMALRLVSGPLPPTGNVRPLVVGTNTGLFSSADNGATFTSLSGGGLLPTTDYSEVMFIANHHDRFYVASDGGGSGSGGFWRTNDGGQNFSSLRAPEAAVTALAVSNADQPTLYVATFKPSTHEPKLWTYHDTGGVPVGPPTSSTTRASASRTGRTADDLLSRLLSSPQLPYIGLGLGALAVLLTAIAAHLRARYR